MPQKFSIAHTEKLDNRFNMIVGRKTVSETEFWEQVTQEVQQLVAKYPEKFDEVMSKVKDILTNRPTRSLTIGNQVFEIKGRK